MKYERFEELPVWKAAVDLAVRVFELVEDRRFVGKGDMRNQLQRASLSVSNNIAEGFERGTTQELITFLYIARGSAGEVRSTLCVAELIPAFGDLKSQISDLKLRAERVSRQLRAWADSLQNTDIKGVRYLNEATKGAYNGQKRAEAFQEKIRRIRERED